MPTKRGQLLNQRFSEICAQIIGMYGDPVDGNTYAPSYLTAVQTYVSCDGDDIDKHVFWSRFLLCEIQIPDDLNQVHTKLAFVVKPRAMWLYKSGSNVIDFIGNSVAYTSITNGTISPVNPPYNFGDIIRVSVLPAAINITSWKEGYTFRAGEFFYKDMAVKNADDFTVSSLKILGSEYDSHYTDTSVNKCIYYDRNVDARSRVVSGSGSDTGTYINVPICVGGVTKTYRIKGSLVA